MILFRLALLHGALSAATTFSCLGGEILTFVSTTGRQYKNVELTRVEKTGIVISSDIGIERLAFEVLPEDMRKRYGYDPKVAAREREPVIRAQDQAIVHESKSKAIVSNDGWVRLEIPGWWKTLRGLHDEATLQVGNKFREEYAIVISEKKTDSDTTLDAYAKLAIGFLGTSMEAGPVENATAGKFAARRRRITEKAEAGRVVYLQYCIETPEGFHQIVMWGFASKERDIWPTFERVAGSFDVVSPPKTGVSER